MIGVKALVFDLDQTLFDRQGAFDRWNECLEVGSVLRRLDGNGYGDREHFFATFESLIGQTLNQHVFTQAILSFLQPDEMLLAVLKKLQAFYQLAILTNGGVATQNRKIHALGLNQIFSADRIFISSQIDIAKPDRSAFDLVAKELGAMPHECFYFGDQMETDVIAAESAGWMACHVRGPDDLQNCLRRLHEEAVC